MQEKKNKLSKKRNDEKVSEYIERTKAVDVDVLDPEMSRNEALRILSESIKLQRKRVKKPYVKDVKKEELKIKNIKALAYMINVYNNILKDEQLDELQHQLDFIEQHIMDKPKQEPELSDKENLEIVKKTMEQIKEESKNDGKYGYR